MTDILGFDDISRPYMTKHPKFYIGDEVRVICSPLFLGHPNPEYYTGMIFRIAYIQQNGPDTINGKPINDAYFSYAPEGAVSTVPEDFLERIETKMAKFKVGDMVIGNEHADEHYYITQKGWIGQVTSIEPNPISNKPRGLFIVCLHSNIKVKDIKNDDEYWVDSACFDLYIPREDKVLIMVDEKDPNKIIARDLITKKTAEAKCNPKDEWDFSKGAKLALERLYPEKKEEEKPKYWSGKVVCVKSNDGNEYFTAGKVYTVNNGKLFDNKPPVPFLAEVSSVEDINAAMEKSVISPSVEFIEFKGEASHV